MGWGGRLAGGSLGWHLDTSVAFCLPWLLFLAHLLQIHLSSSQTGLSRFSVLKCWGGCVHIHLQVINDVHGSLENGPSILGQIFRLPLPPRNAPKSPTTAGEGDCSQFPPKNSETGPPLRKIKTACCAVCRTPGCQGAAVSYF